MHGQRVYQAHSVLASGSWYKIEVEQQGIYKMDLSFLSSLGLTGSIPSNQIRLFGKKEVLLPESNQETYQDDLEELAIEVVDGGDGVLNGNDYILFYSTGPHTWQADTIARRFIHRNNIYSDKVFYFLTLGTSGKRVTGQTASFTPVTTLTSFDERYFHELDSVNFLSSGKEWYGEELSGMPGRSLTRTFSLPVENPVLGMPLTVASSVAARSVGVNCRFTAAINNASFQNIAVPLVGSTPYDPFAQQVQQVDATTLNQATATLSYTYVPGGFNAQGWINWFEAFYRRQLVMPANTALFFRDWSTYGTTAVEFKLAGADAATQVWDVSDSYNPVKMPASLTGTILQFSNDARRFHEYAAFRNSFLIPKAAGRIPNQDLHSISDIDYLMVVYPAFVQQAQRLAQFHETLNKLKTKIVTTEQIYNEFSGGIPNPVAIRDFVKMYYDRNKATWNNGGKYLLLFGKASFDYKARITNNTNFVPTYESENALDPIGTHLADDFFGFLDDHENINSTVVVNQLDIGIGRVPARSVEEAANFVDKVIAYHTPAGFGPWRTHLSFVADDEDVNLHVQDAEVMTSTASSVAPLFNTYKYYLDAYKQESSAAGGRYPEANQAINNALYNGTLIWNYSGHGGWQRLAEEVVLDQQIVNEINNEHRLPLYITATCDFAPFDQPLIHALGENLLVRPKTGAIALMTTTRVVFANSNRIMNDNYLQFALKPDADGNYKTLGQAVQAAKNYTYQNSGDIINNRKFVLLGDPAMRLGFPQMNVVATKINSKAVSSTPDTLRATEQVTIEGEVQSRTGALLSGFNGQVYFSLYEKPRTVSTLGNDAASPVMEFSSQTATLFKGKVTATGGRFTGTFRMPKDINYQFGAGKLSFYANDDQQDAGGFSTNIIIGGIGSTSNMDREGPAIKAYLNDERFVNGSITNEQPVLLLHLADSSGINTGISGIDHDIVATLDGDNRTYFILNDYYESKLDSYQEGTVRFQLPQLAPGRHTIHIKAWDVVNNSGEAQLEFTVVNNEELILDHVLNYPNPFITKTVFWFEHNKPGIDLHTTVEIYSVAGKLIKTLKRTINTAGNRSNEVEWDGKDDFGNKVSRGVYLYRLTVRSADGKKANKLQRLVVL
ncbi:hypothetical protein SY85_11490 [Flavisolibacter tropicus]|uniref:Gingipain domain-containing protein n=2 Tax=Flavisolibacter tropicus TaxID=1492898 RepID=A0A172TVK7_9BACT|nr:hypothetical protein SY85_11490 [Flavisolibacter tropicus]